MRTLGVIVGTTVAVLTRVPALLSLGTTLAAQVPPDTVRVARDSLEAKAAVASASNDRCYEGIHAMQGALYALVVAPAGIPCFGEPDTIGDPRRRLGFSRNHLTMYVSGGAISAGNDTPEEYSTWSGSFAAELLVDRLLVEASVERFVMPEHLRYMTLRVGRMSRRWWRVAGGVTIGYRDVQGSRPHEGVELAFPLVAGGPGGWVRLQTAYVFSARQSSWNYRVQWERLQGEGPVFLGARLDLNSWEIRNRGRLSHGVLGVLVGTTWTR